MLIVLSKNLVGIFCFGNYSDYIYSIEYNFIIFYYVTNVNEVRCFCYSDLFSLCLKWLQYTLSVVLLVSSVFSSVLVLLVFFLHSSRAALDDWELESGSLLKTKPWLSHLPRSNQDPIFWKEFPSAVDEEGSIVPSMELRSGVGPLYFCGAGVLLLLNKSLTLCKWLAQYFIQQLFFVICVGRKWMGLVYPAAKLRTDMHRVPALNSFLS